MNRVFSDWVEIEEKRFLELGLRNLVGRVLGRFFWMLIFLGMLKEMVLGRMVVFIFLYI